MSSIAYSTPAQIVTAYVPQSYSTETLCRIEKLTQHHYHVGRFWSMIETDARVSPSSPWPHYHRGALYRGRSQPRRAVHRAAVRALLRRESRGLEQALYANAAAVGALCQRAFPERHPFAV